MTFSVIVLAAGQGTRMQSAKPKVLHTIAGKPLLHHVLDTVANISPQQSIVVCGYKGEMLQDSAKDFAVDWVWQNEQLGTGHAVKIAYPDLATTGRVLILYGDVPLVTSATLQQLLYSTPPDAVGLLTAVVPNPKGLGRIIRDNQSSVLKIIEEKDATEAQRQINEINTGICVLPYKYLATWLANLQPNNKQNELYLTDIIEMAAVEGVPILAQKAEDFNDVMGVNSLVQLAQSERTYQCQQAESLMNQGVQLYDPARLDIRGDVKVGKEVTIDVNVILEGSIELGDYVQIGPNVIIKDSVIRRGSVIKANSIIEGATIAEDCQVGPFARVRPGTTCANNSKIGNFVEIKNSVVGEKSKINHLSYIGDATVGKRVNIGAGVITCNYDGVKKHKTIIEDDAFIGSNCELVAPVTVGEGATLAAGTTLLKDAPARALTLTKKIITNIVSWRRPEPETKPEEA